MAPACLAFSLAIMCFFTNLSFQYLAVCLMVVFTIWTVLNKKYYLLILVLMGSLLGYAWVDYQTIKNTKSCLSERYFNKKIILLGEVVSIPSNLNHHARFDLATSVIANQQCHVRIRLNWYGRSPYLFAGDQWRLKIKLKHVNSSDHKGGFSYANYLKSQGINARGYVISSSLNQRIKVKYRHASINTIRQKISWAIVKAVNDHALAAILVALTTGSRHLLQKQDWQVFQSTGTSHLVAISGLHVGLVAGLFFYLVSWLWRRSKNLCLLLPAQKAATVGSLVAATLYALLAGMTIPTQRALIMLSILLFATLTNRNTPLWYRLLLALTVILFISPFALLSVSLVLSFFAVFILGFCINARLKMRRGVYAWLHLQTSMFFGLLPLTLFFFHKVSLVMIAANLVAIPYVSFVVVPACLLATVGYFLFPGFDAYLWILGAKCLAPLWWYLSFLTDWPFALWQHTILHTWAFVSLLICAFLLLAPRGFPAKILAVIFCLPLFF